MGKNRSVALIDEVTAGFSSSGEKVRGVAVLTSDKNQKIFRLSLINLAPVSGEGYFLFLLSDKAEIFALKNVGGIETPVGCGGEDVAAAIICRQNGDFVPVAYGAFSKNAKSVKEMIDYAQNMLDSGADGAAAAKPDAQVEAYDDEVVAAENYYAFADDGSEIKENGYGKSRGVEDENGNAESGGESREEKEKYDFTPFVDETQNVSGDTYFDKIKPQIERLFADYPEEKSLSEVVPDSRWVRIKYDDGEYYVVGVLYDKDRPLYLCYGVEGRYGEKPEKINEYCSFIPSSLFNLKGDGYWVMFQRATNGECVK